MGLFEVIYVDKKNETLDRIMVDAISILQTELGKRVYKNEALYHIISEWAKTNNIDIKQKRIKKIKPIKENNNLDFEPNAEYLWELYGSPTEKFDEMVAVCEMKGYEGEKRKEDYRSFIRELIEKIEKKFSK